jgi:hypothetical protein
MGAWAQHNNQQLLLNIEVCLLVEQNSAFTDRVNWRGVALS